MAVRIEQARGDFSRLGGMELFQQMARGVGLQRRLKDLLPTGPRLKSKSYRKFHALMMGFIAGADCLDDMNDLACDPGFVGFCHGKVHQATTYGDYLRSFERWQPRRLNLALRDLALHLRRSAFKEDEDFILDIDSTSHEQHGRKMEGVEYNYDGKWCLDSIQAFDQYGLQYWMDVRKGSTFTRRLFKAAKNDEPVSRISASMRCATSAS